MTSRQKLADELERARTRTLRLVDFDDAELYRQYDPLMSPLVWDLAHIGQQEELWLLRGGDPNRPGILPPAVEALYDAFEHSRASRVDLPLLSPDRARSYCRTVRSAALDALDALPDDPAGDFTFGMVISHENQHDETMLQALNLRAGTALLADAATLPAGRPGLAGTSVLVPGGPFELGVNAASEPYSLDNERPAHMVDVPAFRIGRVPVTNGEWQHFIDDGGYSAAAVVVGSRLAASPEGGSDRAAILESGRANANPVRLRRRHSRRRTGTAHHLLRGRGLRGLGRGPAAHRSGMGEGLRVGSGGERADAAIRGGTRRPRTLAPTWAAPRCARLRSAPTPPGPRPTGPSRCSATSGSGRVRRCGPGRASCR